MSVVEGMLVLLCGLVGAGWGWLVATKHLKGRRMAVKKVTRRRRIRHEAIRLLTTTLYAGLAVALSGASVLLAKW